MSDLSSTELLKVNLAPLVKGYLDETDAYPYVVSGGVHTVSIINNDSLELSFSVVQKDGKVLSSAVPGNTAYTGKYEVIESIDISGSSFNIELGGV